MSHKKTLGRKNSLNMDIINHFNELNEFHKNAILYTFESSSLDDLINNNDKHAVRKFMLDLIYWLIIKQEEEQFLNLSLVE